jgi:hypothetical protein
LLLGVQEDGGAADGGTADEEEQQGFRIGGATAGTRAKRGLELVHLVEGLGPGKDDDGGGPGHGKSGGFAAAARAEHATEATLFRRLLLSRGGASA